VLFLRAALKLKHLELPAELLCDHACRSVPVNVNMISILSLVGFLAPEAATIIIMPMSARRRSVTPLPCGFGRVRELAVPSGLLVSVSVTFPRPPSQTSSPFVGL